MVGFLSCLVLSLSEVSRKPGTPCDEDGNALPPGSAPPPRRPDVRNDDWSPYTNCIEFETAEFLYKRNQMPQDQINTLLDLWAASLLQYDGVPPFESHKDLLDTIDATSLGEVKWESFQMKYNGEIPANDPPTWMSDKFDVWFRDPREVFRNMLDNPDFANETDYAPYYELDSKGKRRWQDFMSGDWAWKQAVCMFRSSHVQILIYWL